MHYLPRITMSRLRLLARSYPQPSFRLSAETRRIIKTGKTETICTSYLQGGEKDRDLKFFSRYSIMYLASRLARTFDFRARRLGELNTEFSTILVRWIIQGLTILIR